MELKNLFLTLLIFIVFAVIYAFNILSVGIANIKKNWPQYRCNPTIMPFASYFGHDVGTNFTYCIQNMQTSYMSDLLKPTQYAMGVLQDTFKSLMSDIQWIRKKIADFVSTITNIIESIFGVFINIMIQFQKIIIKLKDVFGKVLGIMTSLIYLIEGGIFTGTSVMAGPIGETLRFLCFHPETSIKMKDGTHKLISKIRPEEELSNGSKVLASLKIVGNENDDTNMYYRIYSYDTLDYIYVTGSHKIFDEEQHKFIEVKDSKFASPMPGFTTKRMSCLVTDDHLIKIGEHTFWDWED